MKSPLCDAIRCFCSMLAQVFTSTLEKLRGDTKRHATSNSSAKDMSRVPLKKRKYVIAAAANDFSPDSEPSCTSSSRSSYPNSPQDLSTLPSLGRPSRPDSLQDLSTLNSPPQTPPTVVGCSSTTNQPLPFQHQRNKSHPPSTFYTHETSALQYPETIQELNNSYGVSSTSSSPRQHSQAASHSPGLSSGYSSMWSHVSSTYTGTSSPRTQSYPSTASPMPSNYSSSPSPMSPSYNSIPYRAASGYNSSPLSPMMSEYSLVSSPTTSDFNSVPAPQFHPERIEHFHPQSYSANEVSMGSISSNSNEQIYSKIVKKQPAKSPSSPSHGPIQSNLAKDLMTFLPPDLLQSVGTSSSSLDSKSDKKNKSKKFTYRIDGKPLHAVNKQKANGSRSRANLITKTLCPSLKTDREKEVENESLPRGRSSYEFSGDFENNPSVSRVTSQPSSNFEDLTSTSVVSIHLRQTIPDAQTAPTATPVRPFLTLREDHAPQLKVGGARKKKPQQCRFCSNHEIYIPVKGHKYNCEFRDCDCECCGITRDRQEAVRKQQAQTRHQEALRGMRQMEEDTLMAPHLPPSEPFCQTSAPHQQYGEDGSVGSSSQFTQGFSNADQKYINMN